MSASGHVQQDREEHRCILQRSSFKTRQDKTRQTSNQLTTIMIALSMIPKPTKGTALMNATLRSCLKLGSRTEYSIPSRASFNLLPLPWSIFKEAPQPQNEEGGGDIQVECGFAHVARLFYYRPPGIKTARGDLDEPHCRVRDDLRLLVSAVGCLVF